MLTRREYRILSKCREPFAPQTDEERAQINALYKAKFVSARGQGFTPGGIPYIKAWIATNEGLNALDEFEEQAGEKAKQEKHQRFQDQISVWNLAIAVLSFIAGLLVEFFLGPLAAFFQGPTP